LRRRNVGCPLWSNEGEETLWCWTKGSNERMTHTHTRPSSRPWRQGWQI
jgi:hypothetical protein